MRAELNITGRIDPDIVSEAYVIDFIAGAKAAGFDGILLRIDSPGGDLAEGLAIHRAVRESGLPSTALIEGVCDSCATLVALACDRVLARPHATLLIHEPRSSATSGKADELEAEAVRVFAALDRLVAIYCERTGLSPEEAGALVAAERRLDAFEAQRLGFVHRVLDYGERDPDEESAERVDALLADVRDLLQRSREEEPL
jgi:ATP-dependent protease ClpP protease subunit